MNTVADVFEKFEKTSAVAEALGVKLSAASEMRRRSSIPVRYWPTLVDAARQRGFEELTYEKLVAMHQPEQAGAA